MGWANENSLEEWLSCYLCCIFLALSHNDDWTIQEKCCIIWAYFFYDANSTLEFSLIFVGISFMFYRFDAAS